MSATARNQGGGNAGATTLRYYQSTDTTITTTDTEVGVDSVSALNASGSSAESISLTAPSTAGAYYYGACVDAVTGESDTTNNCSAAVTVTVGATPAPDLVVEGLNLGRSVPMAGEAFIINAVVKNRGSASSPVTTIRYYISSDSTISSSDTQLDTVSVIPLGALGGGYVTHIRPTAPSTAGTYYYGACVDAVPRRVGHDQQLLGRGGRYDRRRACQRPRRAHGPVSDRGRPDRDRSFLDRAIV